MIDYSKVIDKLDNIDKFMVVFIIISTILQSCVFICSNISIAILDFSLLLPL